MMNGAQALIRTLTGAGVEVCFSNPGTSEMHFVAALDAVPQMRGVLCLFEGVATGAADGYGRMTGRPAAALLHLGPGLGNGLANLHNARRAGTPLVTVVGDHATYHKRLRRAAGVRHRRAGRVGVGLGAAVAAQRRRGRRRGRGGGGGVGGRDRHADPARRRVVVAAGAQPAPAVPVRPASPVPDEVIGGAAKALRERRALPDPAGRDRGCGGRGWRRPAGSPRPPARGCCARRSRRGWSAAPGLPAVDRLAYLAEMAAPQLAGTRHLILAGAKTPVSFFAYPGTPSSLVPDGCEVHTLAGRGEDAPGALAALADRVAAGAVPARQPGRAARRSRTAR